MVVHCEHQSALVKVALLDSHVGLHEQASLKSNRVVNTLQPAWEQAWIQLDLQKERFIRTWPRVKLKQDWRATKQVQYQIGLYAVLNA